MTPHEALSTADNLNCGISYLIAGGIARNMSENARLIGTGAVVVVVCVVLVMLTHAAGRHLYRNLLVNDCQEKRDEAVSSADQSDPQGVHLRPLETHAGVKIADAALDESDPTYSQCINRIGEGKTWFVVWIALGLILIFGAFQVGLRVNDTLQKLTRDTIGISASDPGQGTTAGVMPNFGDTQAALPAVIAGPDQQADHRAADEMKSTETVGGWLTSLALAFIYLMTQLTGIYAGYSFGFAGKYSKEAYHETRGCQLYETYQQVEQKLIGIANRRIQSLHQRITDRAHGPIAFGGDFYSFLKIHRKRFAQLQAEASVLAKPAAAPAPPPAAAPAAEDRGLPDQLARLQAMSLDEMKAYLKTLPPEQFAQIKPHVAGLVAGKSAVASQGQEIDALFADTAGDKPGDASNVVSLGQAASGST